MQTTISLWRVCVCHASASLSPIWKYSINYRRSIDMTMSSSYARVSLFCVSRVWKKFFFFTGPRIASLSRQGFKQRFCHGDSLLKERKEKKKKAIGLLPCCTHCVCIQLTTLEESFFFFWSTIGRWLLSHLKKRHLLLSSSRTLYWPWLWARVIWILMTKRCDAAAQLVARLLHPSVERAISRTPSVSSVKLMVRHGL